MQTQMRPATPKAISDAAAHIRAGGLVAFPTETVYGLGADALNKDAVLSIFVAKNRPPDNPLIVHIAHIAEAQNLAVDIPSAAYDLMNAFWPGALTLVLNRAACVSDAVTAGLNTVAIRMPSSKIAQNLIKESGCPIAAPSANISGAPSPTRATHVFHDMAGRIPFILDGGQAAVGLESTVLDMTQSAPIVLRPGGVTLEMIKDICKDASADVHTLAPLTEGEIARSPGMKHRHYAPKGRLILVEGEATAVAKYIGDAYDSAGDTGLIICKNATARLYENRRKVEVGDTDAAYAANLFDAMRAADAMDARYIWAETNVGTGGIGLALMNRLMRASEFTIKKV